jgi:hypothetical protein
MRPADYRFNGHCFHNHVINYVGPLSSVAGPPESYLLNISYSPDPIQRSNNDPSPRSLNVSQLIKLVDVIMCFVIGCIIFYKYIL